MAISTNPKPTIYRNLYENTGSGHLHIHTIYTLDTVHVVTAVLDLPGYIM